MWDWFKISYLEFCVRVILVSENQVGCIIFLIPHCGDIIKGKGLVDLRGGRRRFEKLPLRLGRTQKLLWYSRDAEPQALLVTPPRWKTLREWLHGRESVLPASSRPPCPGLVRKQCSHLTLNNGVDLDRNLQLVTYPQCCGPSIPWDLDQTLGNIQRILNNNWDVFPAFLGR